MKSSTKTIGKRKVAVVVTSISPPNKILRAIAKGSQKHGAEFIVIGDTKSPADFELKNCRFYGIAQQEKLEFGFAGLCPTRHYARKNIGYLIALAEGAEVIIETDDDNIPTDGFWDERVRLRKVRASRNAGWLNVYSYFSDENIWPRGLPLGQIRARQPAFNSLKTATVDSPIQQGLADDNPDVDALYRLVLPLPQRFRANREVALGAGSWSPFNSQNTTWWREAAALMYLPAYCSFRMTDIWRSFVAQRIAWENEWSVLYHSPTVRQERNEHDLMRDFKDEIPGYVNNSAIQAALDALKLERGVANIPGNLRTCYLALVDMKIVDEKELPLLDAWLRDLENIFQKVK